MRSIRVYILSLLMFGACSTVLSQNVSDVLAKQSGDKLEITYYIDNESDIQIFANIDGTRIEAKSATGDIGINVKAGRKIVIWNVLDDVDKLVGNISIDVIASMSTNNVLASQKRNLRKQKFEESKQYCTPMTGYEMNGGGVGFGIAGYWGYVYKKPCRWGNYFSFVYGMDDYGSKHGLEFMNFCLGATCTINQYFTCFFAPGISCRTMEDTSKKKVTIYGTSYETKDKTTFAAEAGIGVRCKSIFLMTLRASYPLYVGLGVGIDLGWWRFY